MGLYKQSINSNKQFYGLSINIERHLIIIIFSNHLRYLSPLYLGDLFQFSERSSSYSLRDWVKNLSLMKPNTNYLKNSFAHSGAKLWNKIMSVKKLRENPDLLPIVVSIHMQCTVSKQCLHNNCMLLALFKKTPIKLM